MLYSTGNTHLVSAILTRVTRRSTLDLARDWLAEPLAIRIPPWQRDPQGIYLGGNNMLLTPRALLNFGEMYRNGGTFRGRRVLPESWVRVSWTPRTRSPFSGDLYGLRLVHHRHVRAGGVLRPRLWRGNGSTSHPSSH